MDIEAGPSNARFTPKADIRSGRYS